MKKTVQVVGAIIENESNQILCALRSPIMSLPNYWEFPGGKLELNETIEEAIIREIKEELDCTIDPISLFNDHTHEYDNIIVRLITVKCQLVAGSPVAKEHAKLKWIAKRELMTLNWAPADIPAVNQLITSH